jgi:hypothetical protein
MRPKSYSAVAWDTNSVSIIYKSLAGKWTGYASPTSGSNVALEVDVGRRRREPDRSRALEILNTSDDVRKAEVAAIDKVYEAETRKNALLAKVLKYQKEYAQRAVPHAQKLRPPIEVVVAHYRNK